MTPEDKKRWIEEPRDDDRDGSDIKVVHIPVRKDSVENLIWRFVLEHREHPFWRGDGTWD